MTPSNIFRDPADVPAASPGRGGSVRAHEAGVASGSASEASASAPSEVPRASLRPAHSPSPAVPQAPAIEPAGTDTPGQAAPVSAGSKPSPINDLEARDLFLREARAL